MPDKTLISNTFASWLSPLSWKRCRMLGHWLGAKTGTTLCICMVPSGCDVFRRYAHPVLEAAIRVDGDLVIVRQRRQQRAARAQVHPQRVAHRLCLRRIHDR